MEFTLTQDFPAGMDHLWSTFGQTDYVRRKYRALGAKAVRVRQFKATAQAIDIELERDVYLEPSRLPMWIRALVGPTLTLRHRTAWRRDGPTNATATFDISPKGLPLRAQGLASIVELGANLTRMRMNWRVASTAPVIGDIVEHLLAEQVQAALDADHAFTLQFLASADARRPKVRSGPSRGRA